MSDEPSYNRAKLEYCRNLRDHLIACYKGGPSKDKEALYLLTIIFTGKIDTDAAHQEDLHMAIDLFTSRPDHIGSTARDILDLWVRTVNRRRKYAQFNVPLYQ